MSALCLGRLPHDPIALAAAPWLDGNKHKLASFQPPARLDRSHIDFTPGLWGNDTMPDCTAVALANCAAAVAELNGYALSIGDRAPQSFYAGCVGCEDTDEAIAATNGAVMLDVMKRQLRGFKVGPQELVGLFGVLPTNRIALANAMTRLGHAAIGVTLRERDMEDGSNGARWDAIPGRDDGAVAGGHAVMLWDYSGLGDADTVRIGTWGDWKPATLRWLDARIDEAFGLVWRQLAQATGPDVGVDVAVLHADLLAMAA